MYKHNLPKHVYHYYSIVNILNHLVKYLKNMEFKKILHFFGDILLRHYSKNFSFWFPTFNFEFFDMVFHIT